MPNILEDLYYGNLSPCQRCVHPGSKVQKLSQKHCDLDTKLKNSFTEKQWETFEQYLSVSADLLDANCLDSFIAGFRLGARFTHEIFVGTDAPFAELTEE